MKKRYLYMSIICLYLCCIAGFTSASNSRGLSGVEYTSRAGRGADETWKYKSRAEYKKYLVPPTSSDNDEPTQAQKNRKTATDYVLEFFASEFGTKRVFRKEGKNTLFWPIQYAKEKTKILIHHTATNGDLPQTIEEEKKFMQDTYKFHAFGRGRGDIGYNFVVMPSGRIYEGRKGGAGVIGAHATRNNAPSIGIALVGNFQDITPAQDQINGLLNLLTSLTQKYTIDPLQEKYYFHTSTTYPYIAVEKHGAIAGHRDAGVTACPGEKLYALLPDIKNAIADRIAGNITHTVLVQKSDIIPVSTQHIDLTSLQFLKDTYTTTMGFTLSKASIKRMSSSQSVSHVKNIEKTLVRVLLYDLSTMHDTRSLTCSPLCSVRIAANIRRTPSLVVTKTKKGFSLQIGAKIYTPDTFAVQAGASGTITITSATGSATYRQAILFAKSPLQKIDGTISTVPQLINLVSFEHYMRGIAEGSDSESQTKTNILALLAKGYVLYYIGGSFKHPSIPSGALYNAIDDPRLFQKYIGYGRESMSKNRPQALLATKNMYVSYDSKLPILPYFHCSAGFTWSALEKRGRTDTPYLSSVVDESGKCDDGAFAGHGVGLSGKGAAAMAASGKNETEILQYYYPGVEIVTQK